MGKKITDVDVVSTINDADYLFVNQNQAIRQIKKSDIPKPTYTAEEVGALPNTTIIPTTLPNPNALTFTGAITGSYDGSSPIEVNIPEGGGTGVTVDTTLGVAGQAADAKATGDAIGQLSKEIDDLKESSGSTPIQSNITNALRYVEPNNLWDGHTETVDNYEGTGYIGIDAGKQVFVDVENIGANIYVSIFDENKTKIEDRLFYYQAKDRNIIEASDSYRYIVVPIRVKYSGEITNDTVRVVYGDQYTKCYNKGFYVPMDNRLARKRWLAIGDSITFEDTDATGFGYPLYYYATKTYPSIIADELKIDMVNVAVPGYVPANFFDAVDGWSSVDFDIVTIMLGTNNQGYNHIVGTINGDNYSNGNYSAADYTCQLQRLIDLVKVKYPNAVIGLITPIKRKNGNGNTHNALGEYTNAQGLTTEAYAEQMIAIGDYYGIKACDIYHNGINLCRDDILANYCCKDTDNDPDGLHPDADGHKKFIAPMILDFIKSLAPMGEVIAIAPPNEEGGDSGEDSGGTEPEEPTPEEPDDTELVEMIWTRTGSGGIPSTNIPVNNGDTVEVYLEGKSVDDTKLTVFTVTDNTNIGGIVTNMTPLMDEYATDSVVATGITSTITRVYNGSNSEPATLSMSGTSQATGYVGLGLILAANGTTAIIKGWVSVNGVKTVLNTSNCIGQYNFTVEPI